MWGGTQGWKMRIMLTYLMPFLPVFISKKLFPGYPAPDLEVSDREGDKAPIIWWTVGDILYNLNVHRTMGLHPRVAKQPVEVLAKPLSVTYQQCWLTGEVTVHWRLADETPIHKGRKEDPRNYTHVNPTWVLGKAMEQIIFNSISCTTW